jgi:hypothetical protein
MSSLVPRLGVGGETPPAPPLTSGVFLVIMCVHCTCNLRSSHLRVTLGHAPLCSFILLCASQQRWLNAIGQKKAPPHSLAWPLLGIDIIGTEKRAQVRPACSIFEPRTEPQLNLRSTLVCCEVIL